MPHNWASAEFIRLVRHLLIFERGEGLDLLPGLPPEWRGPGCVTRLDKTPTRFGPVSLLLHVGENQQFTLLIERDPHWPRKPVACRLYLPPGARLTLAGVDLVVSTAGIVDLPWRADLLLRGSFV